MVICIRIPPSQSSSFIVDTIDSVGLPDDPIGNDAIVVPGPSSGSDNGYFLSRQLTGDANSEDWETVFSHFPREFSLTLVYINQSASSENLFFISDSEGTLIGVELQRTGDADESLLVVTFPGVSVSQLIPVSDNEYHSISLKLEGKFLTIYVDCDLHSFLKLESMPENITVTDSTVFTLFDNGYVVCNSLCVQKLNLSQLAYTYVLHTVHSPCKPHFTRF